MEEKKKNDETLIQNAMIELLSDVIEEQKKIQKRQTGIIVFLISLLFASFCYYVYTYSQFDYEDVNRVITEASTDNNSKITNSQGANAQNNINISVPKK